jgi:ketosteroid isomerase-like protein
MTMLKQIAVLSIAVSITTVTPFAVATAVTAQTAQPAPTALAELVRALDTAANKQDLDAVMQFYAVGFTNSDGLTKAQLKEGLQDLWKRYKQLQYRTEITKWELKGDRLVAETITRVQGVKSADNDDFKLEATLTASQTYQKVDNKWQIVSQQILSEKSSLTSGERPPEVSLRLPEIIGVGRQYVLDAIVTEPLGNNLLLGAALEEPVTPKTYIKDTTIDLEPLRAGGVFKIGQAPFKSGDRWISIVLVRETGITIASQRLRVSRDFTGNQYTPLPEATTTPSRVRPRPDDQPTL